ATINTSAITNGDAGGAVIWSDEYTSFNGTILATGGTEGGNGAFVEVSGGHLDFNGSVDTRAPNGNIGTLLLDPTNIYIADDQANATAAGMSGTNTSADTGSG